MNYAKEIYRLRDEIFDILSDVDIDLFEYEVQQWNIHSEHKYDETYDYDEVLLNVPSGYYITKHWHYVPFAIRSMSYGTLQVTDREEGSEEHEVRLEYLDMDSLVGLYEYLKNEGLL